MYIYDHTRGCLECGGPNTNTLTACSARELLTFILVAPNMSLCQRGLPSARQETIRECIISHERHSKMIAEVVYDHVIPVVKPRSSAPKTYPMT